MQIWMLPFSWRFQKSNWFCSSFFEKYQTNILFWYWTKNEFSNLPQFFRALPKTKIQFHSPQTTGILSWEQKFYPAMSFPSEKRFFGKFLVFLTYLMTSEAGTSDNGFISKIKIVLCNRSSLFFSCVL